MLGSGVVLVTALLEGGVHTGAFNFPPCRDTCTTQGSTSYSCSESTSSFLTDHLEHASGSMLEPRHQCRKQLTCIAAMICTSLCFAGLRISVLFSLPAAAATSRAYAIGSKLSRQLQVCYSLRTAMLTLRLNAPASRFFGVE